MEFAEHLERFEAAPGAPAAGVTARPRRGGDLVLIGVNLLVVGCYLGFVLIPWLSYFARHGTGACYLDLGCAGPTLPQWPDWTLVVVGVGGIPLLAAWFYFAVAGPVPTLALAGVTLLVGVLRSGMSRALRRAVLGSGVLTLALGIFAATPMGHMLTVWLAD